MSTRKLNKKSLKIVGATTIALFSLVTVFTATIAWFALNQTVGSNGMNIKVKEAGSAFSKLTVHKCNLNESTEAKLVFHSEPITNASDYTLSNYSDLHKSEPILLLFKLSAANNNSTATDIENSKASNVKISAESTNSSYTSNITEANHSSFPFSTSVYFRSIASSTNSFPFGNVVTDNLIISSFADPTNLSPSDATAGFNKNIAVYDGSNDSQVSSSATLYYVGVILDYYDSALTYLFSQNIGTEYSLTFSCDFTMNIS